MRKLKDLSKAEQKELLKAFQGALDARNRQWDFEAKMEDLLDGDINIDIADWASCGGSASMKDLRSALGEGR